MCVFYEIRIKLIMFSYCMLELPNVSEESHKHREKTIRVSPLLPAAGAQSVGAVFSCAVDGVTDVVVPNRL